VLQAQLAKFRPYRDASRREMQRAGKSGGEVPGLSTIYTQTFLKASIAQQDSWLNAREALYREMFYHATHSPSRPPAANKRPAVLPFRLGVYKDRRRLSTAAWLAPHPGNSKIFAFLKKSFLA
jgi:hypothetical protein